MGIPRCDYVEKNGPTQKSIRCRLYPEGGWVTKVSELPCGEEKNGTKCRVAFCASQNGVRVNGTARTRQLENNILFEERSR